jgi:hypothetical protein
MWKLDGLIADGELIGGRGEGCGLLIELAMVEMEPRWNLWRLPPANWLRGLCGVAGFVLGSCRLAGSPSAASTHDPRQPSHETWRSGHTDWNRTKEHTRRMMPAGQSGEGAPCSTHNSRRLLTLPSVPSVPATKYLPRRETSWFLNLSAIRWFHSYRGWSIPLARPVSAGCEVCAWISTSHLATPQTPHGQHHTAVSSMTVPIRAVWTNVTLWQGVHGNQQFGLPNMRRKSLLAAARRRADPTELTELGLGCPRGCLGGFHCFP